MSILGTIKNWFSTDEPISEELKQFKSIGSEKERKESEYGEGLENPLMASYGLIAHQFYDKYLYQRLDTKIKKIEEYRRIASNAEIADVIEDAVVESTMPDENEEIFKLVIKNEKLQKNKNAVKNLTNEFNELVYNRLHLNTKVQNYLEDYFIDGELYLENVIDINNSKRGVLYWKKLPTETMDFIYNYESGQVDAFIQYLKNSVSNIRSVEDARNNKDVILFNTAQISYMNYGKFSPVDRTKIFGYLEKARKSFNQLNMLETSVIIYRLVRAPERFVFTIDVGNMPRDKGMQFVEKMKQKLSTKESFDPETGLLKKAVNVMSMTENFFLPTSSTGRGSQVSTVGGNPSGFAELDDIYYFQKKLYKALKYPITRVQNTKENRSGDNLFGGSSNYGEIPRDEVKWSVFLESQQDKFCRMLLKVFLIHLEFKGFLKQYGLDETSLAISMNCPNSYREQIEQKGLETKFNNYNMLVNNEEFSKTYLMKKLLDMDEDDIKMNMEGFKQDKEMFKYKDGGDEEEDGGTFPPNKTPNDSNDDEDPEENLNG